MKAKYELASWPTVALLATAFICTIRANAENNPATEALPEPGAINATLPNTAGDDSFLQNFGIGTRITYFWLRDRKRDFQAGIGATPGSFYGSINQLDAQQNYLPLKIFVDYKFSPYCGVELMYDQLRADAITQIDGHSDGTINLIGPIASIIGRYPNATRLTPYAGLGVAYFFAKFDENPRWSEPPGRNFRQTFELDNTAGWIVCGGCDVKISGPWSADLFLRYTEVDVSGIHWLNGQENNIGGRHPDFPLSNIAAGMGVRYSF